MMTDTTTDDQAGLFDMTPTPRKQGRPVTELAALHRKGEALLMPIVRALPAHPGEGAQVLTRVRAFSADPARAHEVTVRYTAASHRKSKEWESLTHGEIGLVAYGWLDDVGDLRRYVVLDAAALTEAIITRPQCLVPATRTVLPHHAPGGAEFLVVDLRKIPNTCLRDAKGGAEIRAWGKHPAPRVTQGGLW